MTNPEKPVTDPVWEATVNVVTPEELSVVAIERSIRVFYPFFHFPLVVRQLTLKPAGISQKVFLFF
jgi:hypothetical protein